MAAWYPIECRHGFDCCPICDGPRRDPKTLQVIDSGSTGFLSTPMHLLPPAPNADLACYAVTLQYIAATRIINDD